jgi:hypothetical protein
VSDCVELRRVFAWADAEFRAAVESLEEREVISAEVLHRIADLEVARNRAWEAYIDCVWSDHR